MAFRDKAGCRGFSLIQISIVMLAASLVLVSLLPGGDAGDENAKALKTINRLKVVEERMEAFMTMKGRRPCPADGQYAVEEHNFGIEAFNSGLCTGGTPAAPLGPTADEPYVVGGTIPTKSLWLPDEYAFDGWGRRFTYVVGQRVTEVLGCYAAGTDGAIDIRNASGAVVDGTMYAYISHGPDGHGAFPAQGSTVAGRINRGSTDADTRKNAGVDANFSYNLTDFSEVFVRKDKTAGFDDIVYYRNDIKNTCCLGDACNMAAPEGFVMEGGLLPERIATSMATGDVNGDGISDLLLSAPDSVGGGIDAGAVYIVFGSRAPFDNPFDLSALDGDNGLIIEGIANTHLAASGSQPLATGDINGDQIGDIIIGSHDDENNGNTGSVFVFFGHADDWPATMSVSDINGTNGIIITGEDNASHLGYALATGDVNKDGLDDIVMGAWGADPDSDADAGSAYVLFGKEIGWSTPFSVADIDGSNGYRLDGDTASQNVGFSVATGDINGDGTVDVITGAPGDASSGAASGSAYVVFGKTSAWTSPTLLSSLNGTTGFRADGLNTSSNAGATVGAGDITGDGVQDLLVGTPSALTNTGYTFLVFGKTSAWASTLALASLDGDIGVRIEGEATGVYSGNALARGDHNINGIHDLVIGAYGSDANSRTNSGSVFLLFGKDDWQATLGTFDLSDVNTTNGIRFNGASADDQAGMSVAMADLNADGRSDAIIGAPGADPNLVSDVGTVYVIFGQNDDALDPFDLGDL